MKRQRTFGLPLLAKELVEQAARPRTYLLRVGYACLLFVAAFYMFSGILARSSGNAFAVLGQGREMFRTIFWFQFWGITLFMPALASGTITREKENNCLELLLLTRLAPWTIVCEKLLSRLIPMLTFVLLSLPLTAFAYTLGGITQAEFWGGLAMLSLYAIQCGAIAMMCSAFCRTTVAAFVSSYLLTVMTLTCSGGFMLGGSPETTMAFVGFAVISLTLTGFSLAGATVFLTSRSEIRPRNHLLEIFKRLDRFFVDMNRFTGNVVLVKDGSALPKNKPIAWRETNKKSLGTSRYLFRVLTVIEIPLLAVLVWFASESTSARFSAASVLLYVVWVIAILIVVVKATTLIAGERSAQTLDVLLATPLTGAEIIKQKCSGVRRLIAVMCVPMLTVVAFEAYWERSLNRLSNEQVLVYLAASLGAMLLYLPLVSWVSLWIGLMIRSQTRAIIVALLIVLGWTFLPAFIPPVEENASKSFSAVQITSANIHPSTFVMRNESKDLARSTLVVNFLIYGSVLLLLRGSCLFNADRCLGRTESGRATAEPIRTS